ncbi:MAG: CBS domain-containing protein, partial [Sphingobacteriaceae bacterium]
INNIKDGELEIGLISVTRETSLIEAVTLMLKHNFSQIPILSGKRDVEGLISWRSIGTALSLGKECLKVADCKEEVVTLSLTEPLFKAVKVILEREVVLVSQKDKTICGIVTSTDIGEQFIALSEPFLLLEQIENHIRKLLNGKLTIEEIKNVLDLTKLDKPLNDLSDLSFGQYIRIIENEQNFGKLKLKVDRTILCKMLDETRIIRNEVMHFNPEAMKPMDIDNLRQTLNFLHILVTTTQMK